MTSGLRHCWHGRPLLDWLPGLVATFALVALMGLLLPAIHADKVARTANRVQIAHQVEVQGAASVRVAYARQVSDLASKQRGTCSMRPALSDTVIVRFTDKSKRAAEVAVLTWDQAWSAATTGRAVALVWCT